MRNGADVENSNTNKKIRVTVLSSAWLRFQSSKVICRCSRREGHSGFPEHLPTQVVRSGTICNFVRRVLQAAAAPNDALGTASLYYFISHRCDREDGTVSRFGKA